MSGVEVTFHILLTSASGWEDCTESVGVSACGVDCHVTGGMLQFDFPSSGKKYKVTCLA
jgi:hypothetical protein